MLHRDGILNKVLRDVQSLALRGEESSPEKVPTSQENCVLVA